MAQFMNATQARGEIERILTNAKFNIVMISPYIKINDELITRLLDAGKRNVKTLMVCREEDLKSAERIKIDQVPHLDLRFNERVHAKCFYNDESVVITSLNLYNSSLGDNREMGILLRNDKEEDKMPFQEAKNEAQFIIRESIESMHSEPKLIPNEKSSSNYTNIEIKPRYDRTPKKEQPVENSIIKGISDFFGLGDDAKGHCLHCGEIFQLNIAAPYCPGCYKRWAKYKDDEYKEKICHRCGLPADTSMKYPLCSSCYKKNK
jgi:hypothetical protein